MATKTDKLSGTVGNLNRSGRPKGAVNKTPAQLKEMILKALDGAGGAEYLERRANDPRTASAFLALIGKVLPMTIAGDSENPQRIVFEWKQSE